MNLIAKKLKASMKLVGILILSLVATTFSVTEANATALTLSSSTPADDATGVALNADIELTFSEDVLARTGNITLKKTSDDSVIEVFSVADSVTISASTVTINPTNNLSYLTEYYVLISAAAFEDAATNTETYAGISSTTALSFTTLADSVAPTLSSSTPADDATGVALNADVVLTFSESVAVGTGDITLKKTSDDSVVEVFSVTDSVTVSGSTVTINPTTDLNYSTEYYLLIDATALDDLAASPNSYAGISSTTALSFTTLAETPAPAPTPVTVYIPTTPQAALTLSSSATTVEWGTQAKLTLTGGSGTGAVTYSSTGTTFCAVNPSGNLTPVSAGTCTVTATKDGDGTYGSAQSNSVTITAVEKLGASATTGSTSNAGVAMVVGKPVAGVATVKFTVADTYAGEKVSVILATKNSAGKTIYKTLGSAKVGSTGAVSFKTKVKLPVGAVLQLKSAGSVILSKSIK